MRDWKERLENKDETGARLALSCLEGNIYYAPALSIREEGGLGP